MKESMTKLLLNKYHTKIAENSRRINLANADTVANYRSFFYDELANQEIEGFPIGSDLVDSKGNIYDMNAHASLPASIKNDCRLRYHYLPLTHEFYIGTTGSGKTTGCVEPQLRAIAEQKNKPNLFITDPKGELFNHNAKFLNDRGYQTFVLNFKNVNRSDRWNPILEIYEEYQKLKDCNGQPTLVSGSYKDDPSLVLFSCEEPMSYYYKFNNQVFSNLDDFNSYIKLQKDIVQSRTDSLVRQFTHLFCPVTSTSDQTWESGSQTTVEGIIRLMLELSIEPDSGFTKDMFTIKTIFDIYNYFVTEVVYATKDEYEVPKPDSIPLGSLHPRALEKLRVSFGNAPRTCRSYIGVFDGMTNEWRQGHIFSLTTGNTVNLENKDKPFAIFVITRDYEKSDFTIAGLFIDYIYRNVLKYNESIMEEGKKPRATHFLLDEFGNIPKIENFENKIATSRSRNIWMHLFVQSYDQIACIYGDKQADIILSNCNSHIYLGSQDYDSINRFARECGSKCDFSLNSDFTISAEPHISPVLKFSDLDLIEPGSLYIKRLYTPVMYSHYIRSYYLNENNYYNDFRKDGLIKETPANNCAFSSAIYTFNSSEYNKKHKLKDNDSFDFF